MFPWGGRSGGVMRWGGPPGGTESLSNSLPPPSLPPSCPAAEEKIGRQKGGEKKKKRATEKLLKEVSCVCVWAKQLGERVQPFGCEPQFRPRCFRRVKSCLICCATRGMRERECPIFFQSKTHECEDVSSRRTHFCFKDTLCYNNGCNINGVWKISPMLYIFTCQIPVLLHFTSPLAMNYSPFMYSAHVCAQIPVE